MSFPFRTTKNSDDTVTIHDVDIFKTHNDRGFDCNEQWMDDAVNNHEKFKSEGFRPAVIVGHNRKGEPEKPVEGIIDKLRRFGKKLFADLKVPIKFFKEMIASGKLPNRSVEVFPKKRRLTALALLGGTPPHFALKQMSPYSSDSGRICYGIDDEDPVYIDYKIEETGNWCRKDYQSDCKKCKSCKCKTKGGDMPKEENEEKYSKSEVQDMIKSALDERDLEFYQTMFEGETTGETEEEKKKREEEEAKKNASVQENQEIAPKPEDDLTDEEKEKKKKAKELEEMKASLHEAQEKITKFETNQATLIINNNKQQEELKANSLRTFCAKLEADHYAIDVEDEVKYMMNLSEENLEIHKKRLPSRLTKVPSGVMKYEATLPKNVDNADPEVLEMFENNKEMIEAAGLTKEEFVAAQYSMGKAKGYGMAGCPTGQIDDTVVAYQGEDYNKG